MPFTDYKKLLLTFLTILILSPIFLSGCKMSATILKTNTDDTSKPEYITATNFLLNTVCTINLYDKQDYNILNGCFDLISHYENIYSRTSETSELYKLNNNIAPLEEGAYVISNELSDIIKDALHFSEISGGAFDITVEPVTSIWNFTKETPVVPDDAAIKSALPLIDYRNIQLDGNKITFAKKGVGIDLGAIAKGYIADRVKEYLLSNGVKSAMINLGGNVLCVGSKPDRTPFHVGIQKPFADRNVTIAVMDMNDLSVVSSGVYERYVISDGQLYHHILDPKTGYPVDNNLISVTIISKKSTDGDGLSTTCFVLGLEKGLDLIASLPDTYAVFITSDDKAYYSKGFQEAIKITKQ